MFNNDKALGKNELQTRSVKAVASFGTEMNDVLVKVALSSVSCANAEANMKAELNGWDFNAVHAAAVKQWNNELSSIEIEGASDKQKRIFYTALYHTAIAPSL